MVDCSPDHAGMALRVAGMSVLERILRTAARRDVTKALLRLGYAAPNKVVAQGGSAGGLLTGAVANIAPELYLAIISQVPFVDVTTTMLDASMPLTSNEWEEWGNPILPILGESMGVLHQKLYL